MNKLESTLEQMSPKRADQLQFFRFISFFFIFILHANAYNIFGIVSANTAAMAVSFFFILSGFTTAYSHYGDECSKPSCSSIIKYIRKKLSKMYPLYLWTLLYAVIYSGIPMQIATWNFEDNTELWQLLRNLFLVQSWKGSNYFAFNGVGWFLSSVMFLYILVPPALYVLDSVRRCKHPYIIYTGIFIALIAMVTGYSYCIRNLNTEFWGYVFPPARMGEFFAGMVLAQFVRGLEPKLYSIKLNNSLVLVLGTILELCVLFYWFGVTYRFPTGGWKYRIVQWLLPNFIVLFTFSFGVGLLSSLFRRKFLVRLGDISFECFLLHPLLIFSGIENISKRGSLFAILLMLICIILLADLIHGRSRITAKSPQKIEQLIHEDLPVHPGKS